MKSDNLETGTDGAWIDWRYPKPRLHHGHDWDPSCALCNPPLPDPDPLTVPATAAWEDDGPDRGLWIGAVILALLWFVVGLGFGIVIGRAWA